VPAVQVGLKRVCVRAALTPARMSIFCQTTVTQEVSQRYQRGEFVESAATLMATGADLGLKGLTNLKGLLKTAVSQIDGYAGPALANDGCVGGFGAWAVACVP
jgi:hypothetical protein